METRFEEIRRTIDKDWPQTPPTRLSPDNKLVYLAAKDALRCPNIMEAQRHLFCDHPMSFMVRPVIEMLYDALDNEVRKCIRNQVER